MLFEIEADYAAFYYRCQQYVRTIALLKGISLRLSITGLNVLMHICPASGSVEVRNSRATLPNHDMRGSLLLKTPLPYLKSLTADDSQMRLFLFILLF